MAFYQANVVYSPDFSDNVSNDGENVSNDNGDDDENGVQEVHEAVSNYGDLADEGSDFVEGKDEQNREGEGKSSR